MLVENDVESGESPSQWGAGKAPQACFAASSPLRGAPFCAGFARVKASSHSGEVAEPARPEGLWLAASPHHQKKQPNFYSRAAFFNNSV